MFAGWTPVSEYVRKPVVEYRFRPLFWELQDVAAELCPDTSVWLSEWSK